MLFSGHLFLNNRYISLKDKEYILLGREDENGYIIVLRLNLYNLKDNGIIKIKDKDKIYKLNYKREDNDYIRNIISYDNMNYKTIGSQSMPSLKLNMDFYKMVNNTFDDFKSMKISKNKNYIENDENVMNNIVKYKYRPIKYNSFILPIYYTLYLEKQLSLFIANILKEEILIESIFNCIKIKDINYIELYKIICKAQEYIKIKIEQLDITNNIIKYFEELNLCLLLVSVLFYENDYKKNKTILNLDISLKNISNKDRIDDKNIFYSIKPPPFRDNNLKIINKGLIPLPYEVKNKIKNSRAKLVDILSLSLLVLFKKDSRSFDKIFSKDFLRYTNDEVWLAISRDLKGNEYIINYIYRRNLVIRIEINNIWCNYFNDKMKDRISTNSTELIIKQILLYGEFLHSDLFIIYKSLFFNVLSKELCVEELLAIQKWYSKI